MANVFIRNRSTKHFLVHNDLPPYCQQASQSLLVITDASQTPLSHFRATHSFASLKAAVDRRRASAACRAPSSVAWFWLHAIRKVLIANWTWSVVRRRRWANIAPQEQLHWPIYARALSKTL